MSQQETPATPEPVPEAPAEAPAEAPPATPPSEVANAALNAKPMAEARVAPRKVLTCRAKISRQGRESLTGRTVDISLSGISIFVPDSIPNGSMCTVAFDVMVNGRSTPFSMSAKVVNSSLGSKGFRIGFQFVQLNESQIASIKELMGTPLAS